MVTKNYFSTHLGSGVIAMVVIMLLSLIPASVYAAVTAPTDVKVTTLTPTSATLGWEWTTTESLDRHDIDIRVSTVALTSSVYPTATTETEGVVLSQTVENLEEPSFLIAPLAEGTYYYVYMRENATHDNQGTSSWVTLTFATPCSATSVLPISGNFDASASQLPACWSSLGTAPAFSSSIYHGDAGNSVKLDGSVASSYLYSPILSSSSNAYYLTAYIYGAAGATYRVGIASTEDWLNAEILLEGTIKTANTWTFIDAVVPAELRAAIEGGMEFLWVIYSAEGDNSSFYVDDVEIGLLPACITPSALTIGEVTENSVQLSWTERGTATSWVVEYSDGTETYQVTANSNPFILGSLTSNTAYTVRVQANCGSESSNWTEVENFKTLCGLTDIPFSESFEDVSDIPDCWSQTQTVAGSGSGTDYADNCWKINTYSSNAHSGSKSLQLQDTKDGTHTILVSPHFATEVEGGLTLSFWMYRVTGNTKPDEGVKVWVNNQPNLNGATALMHVTRCGGVAADALKVAPITTAGWYQYEKVLPIAGDVYVIFEGISEYGSSSYLDDIEVSATPTCLKPTDLHLASFDAESATLAWTAGGSESAWELTYKLGTNDAVKVSVENTPQFTIEGLAANTAYTLSNLSLCAVCSATDSSKVASFGNISFKTPCMAVTTYETDFEDETSSSGNMPECWTKVYSTSTSYPYVYDYSSYANSGTKCLYAYASAPSYGSSGSQFSAVVALPQINGNVSDYRLVFMAKESSSRSSQLAIGVLDDISDTTSFTVVDTITLTSSYAAYTVNFASYTGTGKYVAIKYIGVQTSVYLDDVVLEPVPTCEKPGAISAVASYDYVTLQWAAGGDETKWQLAYQLGEEAAQTVIVENEAEYTISALEASTNYTISNISVKAICAVGDTSYARVLNTLNILTKCGPQTLPLSESFDYIASGVPACWDNSETTVTNASHNWNYYSTNSCLRFNSYSASKGQYGVLKSPIFTVPTDRAVELTFRYKNPAGGDFSVYVSRDGGVTMEEEALLSGLTGQSDWKEMSVSFDAAATDELVICFKAISNYGSGDAYIYLDDVSIKAPLCSKPYGAKVVAVTDNSVDLAWADSYAASYKALLFASEPTTISEEAALSVKTVESNAASFDGLEANTPYYLYIQGICDAENSEYSKVFAFRTACAAEELPYIEDFEDAGSILCWKAIGEAATVQSTTVAFGGSGKALALTSDSVNVMLVSPKFNVESLASYNVNLAAYSNAPDTLAIGVIVDINHPADTYIDLGVIGLATAKQWNEYSFSFAALSEEGYEDYANAQYIAISVPANSSVIIDAVEVVLPAQCAKPTAITIKTIGEDVSIDWTSEAASHEAIITSADTVAFSGVVSKPFIPEGLVPNSDYQIRVRAICPVEGEDEPIYSDWSAEVAFQTPCYAAALPFSENFDDYTSAPEIGYSVSTHMAPECWSFVADGGNYSMMKKSENKYASSGTVAMIFSYTNEVFTLLPTINADNRKTMLTLKYRMESASSSGTFVIGYLTNARDTASFVAVQKLTKVAAFTDAEVIFPEMEYLYPAIKFIPNSSSWYAAFDDVVIDYAPSCVKPSGLTSGNVTTNSAKLSWTANSDENQWQLIYKLSSKSVADTLTVEGTPEYVIPNLTAGTSYTLSGIKLRAICSETDSSEVASFSNIYFSTECGLIETPWFENFDNSPSGKCWSLPSGVTMTTTTSSSYANSGTGILKFATTDTCVVVLPDFGALNGKRFTFTYRAEGTGTNNTMGFIKVGYITNPLDTSTFVALADYNEHVFEHTPGMVIFGSAVPAGARPAIQYYGATGSNWYLFMDDFVIEEVPTCEAPTALNLVAATDASLQIAIVDDADATAWEYALNNVEGAIHALDNSTFMIEELEPQTEYTVYVRRVCGGNASSRWISANFKTACGLSALPFSEGFEDLTSGNIPECWDNSQYTCYASYRWQYNSSYHDGHSGSDKAIIFNAFNATNGTTSTLLTPHINNGEVTKLKLSFYMKNGGAATLDVKISLDGGATYSLVAFNAEAGSSSWNKYTYTFEAPANSDIVVSFTATSDFGSYRMYLDEVVLEEAPACEALAAVTLSNATRHSFDINLTPEFGETPTDFELVISEQELDAAALESASKISLDTAAYPVNGLLLNTMYHVYARVNCGAENGVSAWVNDSIKTLSCAKLNSLNAVNVSRREMDIVIVSGTPHEDKNYELIISDVQLTEEEREAYNGIINVVDTNVYHASGLTRETTYYIYARQSCGEDGVGEWISQVVTTKGLNGSTCQLIGSSSTTSAGNPTSPYFKYSLSENIYTPAEVGQSGLISTVSFYVNSASDTRTIDLYMTHTQEAGFSGNYSAIAVTDADKVFAGSISLTSHTWVTITLDTPFDYNGIDNLLLVMDDNTGAYSTQSSFGADYYSSKCAWYYNNDNTNPNPASPSGISGTAASTRPQTQFCFQYSLAACPAINVANVSHEYVGNGTSSVILNWGASDGDYANSYDILVSETEVVDFTEVVPTKDSISALTATIDGLEPFTDYYVYFRTNCDAEGQQEGSSAWSEAYTFKTKSACDIVSNVQVEVTGKTSAVLSWSSDDDNFVYFLADAILTSAEQEAAVKTPVTDTTAVELVDLVAGQTYYAYVAHDCGDEGISPFIVSEPFTMPESCPQVINLESYYLAHNAVGLKWNRGYFGDETAWEIGIVNDENSVRTISDSTCMFIGLQPDSLYTFYVKALCSDEESSLTATIELRTSQTPGDEASVGDGTSKNYGPICGFYGYERNGYIFTSEDGLNAGVIQSIAWQYYTADKSIPTQIYLKNTTESEFTSTADLVWNQMIADATLVYDATVTTVNGWLEIDITDFQYTGGNLMILVASNVGNSGGASAEAYYTAGGSNNHCYARKDNSMDDDGTFSSMSASGINNLRHNIRFTFEPQAGCRKVADLKTVNLDTYTASITWLPGGDETSWLVYNSPVPMSDAQLNALELEPVTDMVIEIDTLQASTNYYFYISGICSDSINQWAVLSYQTLATCLPVNGLSAVAEAYAANISWLPNKPSFSGTYVIAYGLAKEFDLANPQTYTSVTSDTESVRIEGLSSGTSYSFAVKAICEADDESIWSESSNFTTECRLMALPYVQNFDDMMVPNAAYSSSVAPVFPNCWDYSYDGSNMISVANTASTTFISANSGDNAIVFSGSTVAYVFLPAVSGENGRVRLHFAYRQESVTNSGTFLVGYLTVAGDESTFVKMDSLAKTTSYIETEVIFPQLEYVYPAIKFIPTSSTNYYAAIDDIRMTKLAYAEPYTDITCSTQDYEGYGFTLAKEDMHVGLNRLVRIEESENETAVDTARVLELTVVESSITELTDTACAGSGYYKNGFNISNVRSNIRYELDLVNAIGCDSIVYLTLYVPETNYTAAATICEGDTYQFGTQTLSTSGEYQETFTSVECGCDSIVTLTLTVLPAQVTLNETICEGDSIFFDGAYRKENDAYVAELTNILGCDSTVTLNLTVLEKTNEARQGVFCSGSVYNDNDFVDLDSAGVYTLVLTNAANCDSIITLTLVEHEPEAVSVSATIVQGEAYVFGNNTYTEEGVYLETFVDQYGCDSVVTLTLSVSTDLEEVLSNEEIKAAEKFMHNGILYIRANDIIYDAQGKRVIVRKED